MKILVLGNTCSGKSTLIQAMNAELKFAVSSIDEYRIRFGDFTWPGDQVAVTNFINSIKEDNSNQIIECSGTGKTGTRLRTKLSAIDDELLIIFLNTDEALCAARATQKMWHELKMPGDWLKSIMKNIWEYKLTEVLGNYNNRYPFIIMTNLLKCDILQNVELIKQLINERKRR